MALTKKIILGSGLLLLVSGLSNTAALAGPQSATTDNQQAEAAQAPEEAAQTEAQATAQPPASQPATAPQAASGQVPATEQTQVPAAQTTTAPAGLPPGMAAPAPVAPAGVAPGSSAAPGVAPPGTLLPGTVPPGTVPPGAVPPGAAAPDAVAPGTTAPAAYVPKTEFDNTPHRFNMTQDGKRMSANDFDAWMRAKGYRVARGAPPGECPNAPPAGVETIVGPDGCPVEVSIELDGVTFEFAKSTLRPEAKKTLDQAIEILKRHPELTVEVAGHTDSRGDAAFNQKLSQARAKAVYDYMIENGIAAGQLEGPIGYGESKPIASNDTDAGREENRRTELNIKAVAALPAPPATPATPAAAAAAGATAADGQVVVPAASEATGRQAAAPASVSGASESVVVPAAAASAEEAATEPATTPGAASGQSAATGTIETTAAGHVVVPATGGTTATGHVIKPAAATATGQVPAAPIGTGEQTVAPAPATDQQDEAAEEDEAAPAETDASDDDE